MLGFVFLTYVWVEFGVPETRGVKLGQGMDELFGSLEGGLDENEEVSEETALIARSGGLNRRRGSLGAYT